MKFLNGESMAGVFPRGFAGDFDATSAFVFTMGFAFALAFVLGFAVVVDFAAAVFAAAVFFRIFAAISVVRSSPRHWPVVVRGRGPAMKGAYATRTFWHPPYISQ